MRDNPGDVPARRLRLELGPVAGGLRALLIGGDPPRIGFSRMRLVTTILAWCGAGLLLFASWSYLDAKSGLPGWILPVAAAATAVPLGLMVDRALLAWRIAWVAAVLTGAAVQLHGRTPFSWHPAVLVTMTVVLYLVILRHPRTVGVWAWASMVSLVPLFAYAADGLVLIVAVTVLAVLADQIRRRREVQSRLAVERERTDAESTRRQLLEERTRIARELHDVVAHHMSLIAVRAQSAPYRLGDVPDATATEFGAIADASREALVEMRRLLGVLRSESVPPVQPLPSVEDVAGLVEAARDAAVDVRLDIQPDLQMSPSVGLTTYRIVQEALSNARRHASGAPVRIALAVEDAELVVTVVNGPGTALVATPGGGSTGLIGMRERAAMLGGSLDTGVTEDGGFRVHGRIPLSAEHGPAAEHQSGAQ